MEIRTTAESTLPYAEHFHSSFSLGLILAGHTIFSLGKEKYRAEQGDIVLIAPGQAHSCNPLENNPRSYHMAYIDPSWLHSRVCAKLHLGTNPRVLKPVIKNPELFAEAIAMIGAINSGPATVEQRLEEIFAKLHALYGCFASGTGAGRFREPLPLAAGAEQIMAGHCPVSWLAQKAGLRRESFSRSFHRLTGLPPSRYIHCLRLERGRQMLRRGSSIAEAAAACGYVDQSHFHRAFVKYYSVTPGGYCKSRSHPYNK